MMIPLKITLDGDGAFRDLTGRDDLTNGLVAEVTMLKEGMTSGKPSVALRIDHTGGVVVAETSWALFWSACRALEARYGVPE